MLEATINRVDLLGSDRRQARTPKDRVQLLLVEELRPLTSHLNMHGAQIPGQSYSLPSPAFQEGYEHIEWDGPKDRDAVMTQIEELKAAIAELKGGTSKTDAAVEKKIAERKGKG